MGQITGGEWRVPLRLRGAERGGNGVIVIAGAPGAETLVADCRNRFIPEEQQRANAELISKAVRMRDALRRIERELGDMPAGKGADLLYAVVIDGMKHAGITAEPEE